MAVTAVASATSSTTLLAASLGQLIVANTDANDLYVLLGEGTASSSNYSFVVATGDEKAAPGKYTGPVTGVWAGDGSGSALITTYSGL